MKEVTCISMVPCNTAGHETNELRTLPSYCTAVPPCQCRLHAYMCMMHVSSCRAFENKQAWQRLYPDRSVCTKRQ